jgi:glycerophosphoryl diester phosphodiesterase
LANSLCSALATSLILWAGSGALSLGFDSPWLLRLTVAGILLTWSVVQVFTMLLSATTLALVITHLYFTTGRSEEYRIPDMGRHKSSRVFRLSWLRVAALLAVACLVAVIAANVAVSNITDSRHIQIVAHRGASGTAPENTLAAVREAIDAGADWVEIDVQESKDGVVMVAHDRDLKRVAGSALTIWESTAEDLRTIDIGSYFDPKFKDERVPTLDEVLQLCKGRAHVYIELKYYGYDRNLEQRVIERVEAHQMQADVRILSLNAQGLQKIKALRPTWNVGLLTAVAAGDLTRANADVLAVKDSIAKSSFIRAAHRSKKDVLVWTVNDRQGLITMIGRNVDGIITDHPALAVQVLREHATLNPVERLLLKLADFLHS